MNTTLQTAIRLKPNPDWAKLPLFDRTGWKRMAFGEFAENIGERAEPKDAQEEIYVGLEHLDPQCLHIRRWGKGSDVIGGKLRFQKGDIIFGKRRAYQRKLAVAEFGGICSAHAMVIRARPDKVLPEFLPFLMMSDRFMNRAVEISVGSLSPTINWTTLKHEPFTLPPLDHQRCIAEILWAVDEVNTSKSELINNLQAARTSFLIETFSSDRKLKSVRAVEYCSSVRDGTHDSPKQVNVGIPLVTSKHLLPTGIDFSTCYKISINDYEQIRKRSGVDQYDILLGMIGTIGNPLLIEEKHPQFAIKNIALFKFGGDEEKARWLMAYLQSTAFEHDVARHSTGNAQKFLSLGLLRNMMIPNPDSADRMKVIMQLKRLDEAIMCSVESRMSADKLSSVILNSIF